MHTAPMNEKERVAVIGLGYVGLPVAMGFARVFPTLGFDIDATRVAELQGGEDRTREFTGDELRETALEVTSDATRLAEATFYIVTVPTPIDADRRPDLRALRAASRTVASALSARRRRGLRVDGLPGSHRGGLRAAPRGRLGADARRRTSPSGIRPNASTPGTESTAWSRSSRSWPATPPRPWNASRMPTAPSSTPGFTARPRSAWPRRRR